MKSIIKKIGLAVVFLAIGIAFGTMTKFAAAQITLWYLDGTTLRPVDPMWSVAVSATPGGSTGNIQYNNGGALAGIGSLTFNSSLNMLVVANAIATSSFAIPTSTAPTTDVFGEIAGDSNAWATGRGAVQFYDGTANTYLLGALTSDTPSNGQVAKWNTGGTITWEDDSTGTSFSYPWTPTTVSGIVHSATTSPLLLSAGAIIASSSIGNLTAGTITATSSLTVTPLTSALILTGAGGLMAEYTGTSCTNQFVRSLSALGAATCETVANTDLANSTISGIALGSNLADLTATNSTLTFSGAYNGGTARTVGINLATANTWTGLITYNAGLTGANATSTGHFYSVNSFLASSSIGSLVTGSLTATTTTATSTFNGGLLFGGGKLFAFQNGNLIVSGSQVAGNIASTTAANTQTVNWNSGNTQRFILDANTNFVINATSSNPIDGGKYLLKICQPPAGSKTVTFTTPGQLRWIGITPATSTLPTAANKCLFLGLIYDSTYQLYNVASTTGNLF